MAHRLPSDEARPRLSWRGMFTEGSLLGVVLTIVLLAVVFTVIYLPRAVGDDWAALWIAGRLFGENHTSDVYTYCADNFALPCNDNWQLIIDDIDVPYAHPFVYAPVIAWMMSFVASALTFSQSLAVVTALNCVALPTMVASAYYVWNRRHIGPAALALISAVLYFSAPVQSGINLGQTTSILLAGMFLGIALIRSHRVAAGVLMGASGFVKLTPLIAVAPLVARKRTWLTVLSAGGVAAAGLLASLVVAPASLFKEWLETIQSMSSVALPSRANQSVVSMIYRSATEGSDHVPMVTMDDPVVRYGILAVTAAIVALAGFFALRGRDFDMEKAITLALCGTSILSGVYWVHYAVIVILLAVGTFRLAGARNVLFWLQLAAIPFFFAPLTESIVFGEYFAPTVEYSILYGSLLSLGLFIVACLIPRRTAPVTA